MQSLTEVPRRIKKRYGKDIRADPFGFQGYFSQGIAFLGSYSGPGITIEQAADAVAETFKLTVLRWYQTRLNAGLRDHLAQKLYEHISNSASGQQPAADPVPERKRQAESKAERAARRQRVILPALERKGIAIARWAKLADYTSKTAANFVNGTTKHLNVATRKALASIAEIPLEQFPK